MIPGDIAAVQFAGAFQYLWLALLIAVPFLAWFSLHQFRIWLVIVRLRKRTDGAYQWYVMVTQYQYLREQFRLRHWTRKRNGATFYEWRFMRESDPVRRFWSALLGKPPRLELETDDEQLLTFAVDDLELPIPAFTVRELMNTKGYAFNAAGELVPLERRTYAHQVGS